jgi:hypothetical protein
MNGSLYPEIYHWDNLLLVHRKASRGKRGKAPAARFEYHLEDNLVALQDELRVQAYRPGPRPRSGRFERRWRKWCALSKRAMRPESLQDTRARYIARAIPALHRKKRVPPKVDGRHSLRYTEVVRRSAFLIETDRANRPAIAQSDPRRPSRGTSWRTSSATLAAAPGGDPAVVSGQTLVQERCSKPIYHGGA